MSGYRDLKCINFTVQTAHSVLAIKMSLSSFAIIVNVAVIIFIVYTRKFRDFIYRLILYLMITDVLQAFAIIIIQLPIIVPNDTAPAEIRPGKRWADACVGSGFTIMATMWMGNIVVFWIVLYLLWLGWSLYRRVYRKRETHTEISHSIHQESTRNKFKEVFGVIFLFVVPVVIAIIPLVSKGGMYGLSGLWCWIKLHSNHCGDLHSIPLAFALMFFYVPLMVIVLCVAIFMTTAFICCCRGEVRRHDKNKELKQRYTREIIIMFAFPLAYCCVCIVLIINRVYSTVHAKDKLPYVPLWIAHSVADPLRVVLPAVVFLVNPCVWKDARAHVLKIRPSSPDQDKLVPKDRKTYGSYDVRQEEYEATLVNE